jgi:hypothetical protein
MDREDHPKKKDWGLVFLEMQEGMPEDWSQRYRPSEQSSTDLAKQKQSQKDWEEAQEQ